MFKTIKNALKTPEVRKKLWYTLLLIIIFRLGCYITVPGVNSIALSEAMSSVDGVAGLINMISGGAFSRFSIFAMSITPYITASIVVQLLAMIIPSLERLTKEGGEEGRKKIDKYTKIITIILALVEAIGLFLSYKSAGIFVNTEFLTGALVVVGLVGGTSLLMWLGDQITSKGIGNGISIIIFVGIVSGLPSFVTTLWGLIFTESGFSTTGLLLSIGIIIGAIILIAGVVFVQQAERRVPVQYSKKVVGRKMVGAQNTHIPLKLAMAGVMPIIFASSLMQFPVIIAQLFGKSYEWTRYLSSSYWCRVEAPKYSIGLIVYIVLLIIFAYFYTSITFNPVEVADNLKKAGGVIPGITPGKSTSDYLNKILNYIVFIGAVGLLIIALIPIMCTGFFNASVSFGGTSIIIIVGVVLETLKQIESQMCNRYYKGFLSE